jgi:hypothetical protein
MFGQAAKFLGKQGDRAVSVLRGSKRILRSLSLPVLIGTLVFSGSAMAQWFRFELVDQAFNPRYGGSGDFHIMVGEFAVSGSSLTIPTFNPPATFSDQANWSSNIGTPAGKGGITGAASVNYAITRIGSIAGTPASGTLGTSGGNFFISALNFGWTDASGASYYVTGTNTDGTGPNSSNWTLYSATWNNTTLVYENLVAIPAPAGAIAGRYLFTAQSTDFIAGAQDANPGIETGYGPNVLPEINASALQKALLLLGSMYLFVRYRKCA